MMTPEKAEQGEQTAHIFLLNTGANPTHVSLERVVDGGAVYSYWLNGSLAHGKYLVFVDDNGVASWSRGVIVNIVGAAG